MVRLTLEVSTAPYPTAHDWRCARVRIVGPSPMAHATKAHARTSNSTTHLELHDRLADHREQPRRKRDKLRRELRMRHTGGDRRRRLPVPREQHRREQLEPLQQHISTLGHSCMRRRTKGRRALMTTATHSSLRAVPSVPRWRYTPRVPVSTPRSTRAVPLDYPACFPPTLGSHSACAPPSEVAGLPRPPRPAKSKGIAKLQSPAKDRGKDRGVRRVQGDVQPAARWAWQ